MDSIGEAPAGSAQSEPVVSVRGLIKRYASHEAVAGIDLEVRRGEIFAFLGPNGAGKTTTVEILESWAGATTWPPPSASRLRTTCKRVTCRPG
jgi:ABC-type glutathione transport system ATPase component